MIWVLATTVAVVAPLLRPGVSLGPFDLLAHFGLTQHAGVRVHNRLAGDQILQFVPWSTLAWRQVHAGHLPLWNSYNLVGTPLAFNWQSAVFSIPNLISYLFPLRYVYTVIVVSKLLIAATGAYLLCRLCRLGALAATFGAVTFELAGPMLDHYGWAMTGVTMWAGWAFAMTWMVVRGQHRARYSACLAVVLALTVYGGHPESLAVMALSLLVFVVVAVVSDRSTRHRWRPWVDLGSSVVGGAVLSAPLLLPGWQLAAASAHHRGTAVGPLPASRLVDVLVAGQGSNYEVACYLGVIAVVLAVVGLRTRWSDPRVKATAALSVVGLLVVFTRADAVLQALPGGGLVDWNRADMPMALAVAVLAAFGLQALVDDGARALVGKWMTLGFAVGGGLLAMAAGLTLTHRSSVVGPAVDAAIGAACAVVLWTDPSRRRWTSARGVGAVLLATQSVFLVASGVSFWSESGTFFAPTPAVSELQRLVGSSLVGFGSCRRPVYAVPALTTLGVTPEANIGFAVHEFAAYDAMVPYAWTSSWRAVSGQWLGSPAFT
ncbi:MAG TPA: hypothetical protein VK386_08920, partial [Acidimicrobiales bacterium]|nr:hypothetical protein [Acidimicrobiales bacterium]